MLKTKPKLQRWQYTYSGWLRLIKCREMTNEEERTFIERLWNDNEFAKKIYKEFEDWQAEEDEFCEEEELETKEFSKKKSRRIVSKYKGRGKYVEKDY